MVFRSTALPHRLIIDAILLSRRTGLPADRAERLPEVDRTRARDTATPWFPCDFRLQRRLSPAVPRENPNGYCGIGGCGVPFKLAELQVGEKA